MILNNIKHIKRNAFFFFKLKLLMMENEMKCPALQSILYFFVIKQNFNKEYSVMFKITYFEKIFKMKIDFIF